MPKYFPCRMPGCGALRERGQMYCDKHPQSGWEARPSASRRAGRTGSTRRWRELREKVLKRSLYLCAPCGAEGKLTPATEVDHIVPLGQGGAEYDISNLQPICKQCHRDKTKREQ